MGDFDRVTSATTAAGGPKDQTKQVIVMIVLAVALFGYMGFRYLRPSNAAGSESPVDETAAVPVPLPSPEEMQKMVDPTKDVLKPRVDEPRYRHTPNDPFALSPALAEKIIAKKVVVVATGPATATAPAIAVVSLPNEPTHYGVDTSKLRINAILKTAGQYSAIINGKTVFTGMLMKDEGVVVLQVTESGVILRNANDEKGIPTPLNLNRDK